MAWKNEEKPGVSPSHRQALLTHSLERYQDEIFWKDHVPGLKLGPPSWQWMDAAYKLLAMMDAPGSLEKIALTLMMLAAAEDGVVDIREICRAADRLPECRLPHYWPNADHANLRVADAVRLSQHVRKDGVLHEEA